MKLNPMFLCSLGSLGILALLLNSCGKPARHDPALDGDSASTPPPSLSIAWEGENDPPLRELSQDDSGEYESDAPVTLPQEIPDTLSLTVTIPGAIAPLENIEARAKIRLPERDAAAIAEVMHASSGRSGDLEITARVSGLGLLFGKESVSSALLRVEFTAGAQPVLSVRTPIRPAPLLKIERFDLKKTSGDRSDLALLAPKIDGHQIDLLEIHRLTNPTDIDIEARLTQKPGATVTQENIQLTYRDTGCQGAGYAIEQSSSTETLSADVSLLPMGGDFLTRADQLLRQNGPGDPLVVTVPANGSLDVGVYAFGTEMDSWMLNGPKTPELRTESVPSECVHVCVPGFDGACLSMITMRNNANISVGLDRKSVVLNWPTDQLALSARYADLGSDRDPVSSSLPMFSAQTEIDWLK